MDLHSEPPSIGHAVSNYRVDVLTENEWREKRKTSLGCSEASAVAGLNKYRSPLDVYMQKCGLIQGFTGSRASRMGSALEPFIASEFYRETGLECHEVHWNLSHPDEPRFTATLDRVCYEARTDSWAVVELKNPGWRQKREWASASETGRPEPGSTIESYFYQTIGQMSVTGLNVGYLVGLVDKDLFVVRIERGEELDELCRWIPMQVGAFWRNHIEKQVPPPADARDLRSLDILYREPVAKKIHADKALAEPVGRLREIREQIKTLTGEANEIVAQLKSTMGDAVELWTDAEGKKPIKWCMSKTTRFDTSAFKKANPEKYDEFSKTTNSRRFTY